MKQFIDHNDSHNYPNHWYTIQYNPIRRAFGYLNEYESVVNRDECFPSLSVSSNIKFPRNGTEPQCLDEGEDDKFHEVKLVINGG
jgi:hypothetical protein